MADPNIVMNGDFSAGIESWYPNGCEPFVVSSDPFSSESMSDSSSCGYAVVTNRKDTWQGLEQDITTRVSPGITYTVSASVGVSGPFHQSVEVLATVRLEHKGSPTEYLFIGKSKPGVAAVVACMMPFMLGFCFLCPSMDCLWTKQHHCPQCGNKVADFEKSDPCLVMDPPQWKQPSFALPA